MTRKLKLWTGIGTYALVSVGAVSPALSESTAEDYRSLPDEPIPTLVGQANACVAIPVEGGGEADPLWLQVVKAVKVVKAASLHLPIMFISLLPSGFKIAKF